ncbi:hypothetical protein RF11_06525 [Thelohanellus kitauei]|uniref:Uncharacterized protein n=1 Tax=Thelohanellus kitauei TaxID=669202 RepID=A0A0C2ING1_THEKT|nr:hypothetical protein RF11_06525 [Thelohanellus kitauei]
MPRKARKYISNEAHELIISMAQEHRNTLMSISETLKKCRESVANHFKMNGERQTFLPVTEKCRNTCVRRNAMFTNMEQTIYNAIARFDTTIRSPHSQLTSGDATEGLYRDAIRGLAEALGHGLTAEVSSTKEDQGEIVCSLFCLNKDFKTLAIIQYSVVVRSISSCIKKCFSY